MSKFVGDGSIDWEALTADWEASVLRMEREIEAGDIPEKEKSKLRKKIAELKAKRGL